jgi:hypothetical protein
VHTDASEKQGLTSLHDDLGAVLRRLADLEYVSGVRDGPVPQRHVHLAQQAPAARLVLLDLWPGGREQPGLDAEVQGFVDRERRVCVDGIRRRRVLAVCSDRLILAVPDDYDCSFNCELRMRSRWAKER